MPKTNSKKVLISGDNLTISDIVLVSRLGKPVQLNKKAIKRIELSLSIVKKAIKNRIKVYGVTTGFGKHADIFLENPVEAKKLQKNIILSHIVSVGNFLDEETTRAIMLLRANTLAKHYKPNKDLLIRGNMICLH